MRFVKPIFLIILAIGFYINLAEKALALGGYLTGDYGQVAPVEVRAIIDFDGKTQKIIASQTFTFNPLTVTNFYWVLALPERINTEETNVKKYLKKDPFLELEKKTDKQFSKDNFFEQILFADIKEEKFQPSQSFSREAYIKFLRPVPKVKSLEELEAWFAANAYMIPKNAKEIFEEYRKKSWYFYLANIDGSHLEMDARDSLTISGAHTIPFEVSFATDKIIYPLKLTAIQPDRDSISTPLSFTYGSASEEVLGVKDSRVDALLTSPSSKLYPPLLLDLMNVKIELFVKAPYPVEAEGFTTIYADKDKDRYLTRLISFTPLIQLNDVELKQTKDLNRINPRISVLEKTVRVGFLLGVIYFLIKIIRKLRLRRHR